MRESFSSADTPSAAVATTRTVVNVDEMDASQIYNKCVALIPGLYDRDQPSIQLAARSNFFDCVMTEALAMYSVGGGDGAGDSGENQEEEEEEEEDYEEEEPELEEEKPWWCWWC